MTTSERRKKEGAVNQITFQSLKASSSKRLGVNRMLKGYGVGEALTA